MKLQSTAFTDGGTIPKSMVFNDMGCTGDNRSPQLSWSEVPQGTKSFALVMHDPDAPTSGGFYHWVMFNIPGDARELKDDGGRKNVAAFMHGEVLGHNDFGKNEYGGPCPPPGPAHHYNLTLHAVDTEKLPLDGSTTGAKLEFTVASHTLATAHIVGTYGRSSNT
ncbi:MAG: YbhB/YbcL family Raf kinase inhibitor-like protein [Candidatus Eremiobacteraeota bacterium]|nr:YbhB/YbcL family Raf kinase inhibitor-like protein [Candidatus Eremiobacteraeota bacterium]MBC5802121.1 YbhB/YbcL family Raf kinase inhibitor-like protein [Candidatus Eremiobacteraeota bacterium]MBC5822464.1 YbhB/YbcL family Raf kinase inhibitor-like protein [Candidatus Eremiobacteraeota bacterium]